MTLFFGKLTANFSKSSRNIHNFQHKISISSHKFSIVLAQELNDYENLETEQNKKKKKKKEWGLWSKPWLDLCELWFKKKHKKRKKRGSQSHFFYYGIKFNIFKKSSWSSLVFFIAFFLLYLVLLTIFLF